jgi:hypothetical protein
MTDIGIPARPLLDCRPAAFDLVRIVLDHWPAQPHRAKERWPEGVGPFPRTGSPAL